MTLGNLLQQLTEYAIKHPAALNQAIMVDDGDEYLGPILSIEPGFSNREDGQSGVKVLESLDAKPCLFLISN